MKHESINHWHEVERAIEENSISGFKIACIEARKVFIHKLKEKKLPTENLKQTLVLFGHKFTNLEALNLAIEKTDKIINSFDYRLSSFEAEDIVEAFTQAVTDIDAFEKISFSKKLMISIGKDEKRKINYKLYVMIAFSFLLMVKILSNTKVGLTLVNLIVKVADFIFSWFLLVTVVAIGVFVFIIITFAGLDRKKTRIKSVKEK